MTKARDIANNSSGALAAAALPKSGGALTGAVTTNSTFDGRDVAADGVLATNALPKAGGTVTGNLTTSGELRTTNINTASSTGTLVMFGGSSNKGGTIELSGGNNTGATGSGIVFKTGASTANPPERVRINSSGNVGIGVVPETWNVYSPVLQVGSASTAVYQTDDLNIMSNAYYNGGWKYIATDTATRYQQSGGAHAWSIAASGSADATISWVTKLKIDSDGLKFNTDTAAANALNDYETGSFTFSGDPLYPTTCKYVKIGNIVHITGRIKITALTERTPFQAYNTFPFVPTSDRATGAMLGITDQSEFGAIGCYAPRTIYFTLNQSSASQDEFAFTLTYQTAA